MATATKGKPRRKPVTNAGKRGLGRAKKQAQARWKRTTRKHPTVGLVAYLVAGVASVVMLVIGLTAETLLFRLLGFLVAALGGLGTLALKQARKMEDAERQAPRVRPQGDGPRRPPPPSPPSGSTPPPATGGLVKCTETGKVASECDCATRHVATAEGAERYGRRLGEPYGKRKKKVGG